MFSRTKRERSLLNIHAVSCAIGLSPAHFYTLHPSSQRPPRFDLRCPAAWWGRAWKPNRRSLYAAACKENRLESWHKFFILYLHTYVSGHDNRARTLGRPVTRGLHFTQKFYIKNNRWCSINNSLLAQLHFWVMLLWQSSCPLRFFPYPEAYNFWTDSAKAEAEVWVNGGDSSWGDESRFTVQECAAHRTSD